MSNDVDNIEGELGNQDPEAAVDDRDRGDQESWRLLPWNPDDIRVHTHTYSLQTLLDMIDRGVLDLTPDFQRSFVWKEAQQCALVESLLLSIPLPSIYLIENEYGHMQVLDGMQRLTAIHRFVRGDYSLGRLQYLRDLQYHAFHDLGLRERRRIYSTLFVTHVLDANTPNRVKLDIFKRLNTGGSPLTAQEIRHCTVSGRLRALLKSLVEEPSFVRATGGSLKKNVRMDDREMVLRFIAFRHFSIDEYTRVGAATRLDDFLEDTIHYLEDLSTKAFEAEAGMIRAAFVRGMENAQVVFGDMAFRRWPEGTDRRLPINRALLEVWAIALSQHAQKKLTPDRVTILVQKARKMMAVDAQFIEAISRSTSDPARVRLRFERVDSLVSEVLG